MTLQDLRVLAKSWRVPRLLQKSVKRTLSAYEKSTYEIAQLSNLIYTLKQMGRGKP